MVKDWKRMMPETDRESTPGGDKEKKPSPPLQPDAEDRALRSSMEEIAQLASSMNESMKSFARHHDASVKDYEERLETANGKLNQSTATLHSLKEECKVLGEALRESNLTEEYYEQVFVDTIQEKDDAVKKAALERDEAYDACNILQAEIDLLRRVPDSTSPETEHWHQDNV